MNATKHHVKLTSEAIGNILVVVWSITAGTDTIDQSSKDCFQKFGELMDRLFQGKNSEPVTYDDIRLVLQETMSMCIDRLKERQEGN